MPDESCLMNCSSSQNLLAKKLDEGLFQDKKIRTVFNMVIITCYFSYTRIWFGSILMNKRITESEQCAEMRPVLVCSSERSD